MVLEIWGTNMFFQSQEDIRAEYKEILDEEEGLRQKRDALARRRERLEKLCKREHRRDRCPDCGWETY